MTKARATKRALWSSIVALLLCFTMLMGATFAWFTDNVSSTGNRIQSGDLEVDLVMYKDGAYTSIAGGKGDIFSEAGDGFWEPGKTQIVYLGVQNKGNLALKYNILLDIRDGNMELVGAPGLIGSLEYAIIDGVQYGDIPLSDWDDVVAAANGQTGDVTAGQIVAAQGGVLDEVANDPSLTGDNGETDFFALAVHMKEEATNEYENGAITIDILVNATQKDAEEDSFGKDYDAGAEFEEVAVGTVYENAVQPTTISSKNVSVEIPLGAKAGEYRLDVSDVSVETENDESTLSLDISLSLDGEEVEDATVNYPVKVIVGKLLNITEVTHKGVVVNNYSYDAMTGIITFNTSTFSPFTISYTTASDDVEFSGDKIVAGTFRGLNPATVDASLADENSEYIAVNYEKDGETYYTVAKRNGKTVVVADAESDVTAQTNGNFTFTKLTSDNALHSVFSGLQNEEFSTVYILPGTYNCATTLYVYSSMDIIGLGDKDSVKIIKDSSSNSNRHLFNANGTKADYIEVTLRNLYLDATANTTGGKDNAAVQSIRKSKVKCYDLTIVKGTALSAVAFYVNGNNAVDGVKYTAYLYAENCTLNAANTYNVISTAGDYKFYHNGLKYNSGAATYTKNSGSIKNIAMDANDWEW